MNLQIAKLNLSQNDEERIQRENGNYRKCSGTFFYLVYDLGNQLNHLIANSNGGVIL